MKNKNIRTCCVCHSEYFFCPVCNSDDRNKPNYYFSFCSENCKDIYDATSKYENGEIDATTANEQLIKLDLSKKGDFGESYKNTLKKIQKDLKDIKVVSAKEVTQEVKKINEETVENVETETTDKVVKDSSKKRGNKNVE